MTYVTFLKICLDRESNKVVQVSSKTARRVIPLLYRTFHSVPLQASLDRLCIHIWTEEIKTCCYLWFLFSWYGVWQQIIPIVSLNVMSRLTITKKYSLRTLYQIAASNFQVPASRKFGYYINWKQIWIKELNG